MQVIVSSRPLLSGQQIFSHVVRYLFLSPLCASHGERKRKKNAEAEPIVHSGLCEEVSSIVSLIKRT